MKYRVTYHTVNMDGPGITRNSGPLNRIVTAASKLEAGALLLVMVPEARLDKVEPVGVED